MKVETKSTWVCDCCGESVTIADDLMPKDWRRLYFGWGTSVTAHSKICHVCNKCCSEADGIVPSNGALPLRHAIRAWFRKFLPSRSMK